MTFKYLFPFEEIEKNSKVVIYGAGEVGRNYLEQIILTNYCHPICFVDRQYDRYLNTKFPVYPIEKLSELEFNYIVIATKSEKNYKDILQYLQKKFQLEDEKIIFVGERKQLASFQNKSCDTASGLNQYAFMQQGLSIALRMSYGLGDCIMQKKIFEELVKIEPKCLIDIYVGVGGKEAVEAVYGEEPNLNRFFENAYSEYEHNYLNYDISLWVTHVIQVDKVDIDKIKKVNPVLAQKMILLSKRTAEYNIKASSLQEYSIHFARCKFGGYNCYSAYNYQDVFDIKDTSVNISLNKSIVPRFKDLNLKSYITINYGWGGLFSSVAKAWPAQYFEKFTKLFKEKYSNIEIIQLGKRDALKINGVDRYILGEDLEFVKYILKNAIFHLDIEGGLVHLATQLGTKSIVLFGPTPVHFFGYKQNINIVSQTCKECYLLFNDHTKCAKNMKEPECMYSITPEIIMEKIEGYLYNCCQME